MGAEFSRLGHALRSFPSPPSSSFASSSSSSSSSTSRSAVNYLFDAVTRANTRANRSPTPVSRHVALARLANRLAALGHRQRFRAIRSLRLSPRLLRQLGRYVPLHLFSPAATGAASDHVGAVMSPRLTGQGQDTDPPFRSVSLCAPQTHPASVAASMTAVVASARGTSKKSVSFAPLAEMRTYFVWLPFPLPFSSYFFIVCCTLFNSCFNSSFISFFSSPLRLVATIYVCFF